MTLISALRARSRLLQLLFTLSLAAWAGLLLICLLNLFVFNSPQWDQSWYLCAAQRVLSGARIYGPQIAETNPPLILWFSTIPVFLGHLLHLDPIPMLKLTVLAAIFVSLAWSSRILRDARLGTSPALLYFALFSILSAEILLHGFDIGQREHLLVIFIVPYILSAACGSKASRPLAERCAIGLMAGIAVCFKPQQVLIIVGLEIFLVLWNHSLRRIVSPEFLSAVLAVLAYIVLVRLATPLYFKTMIPLLRDSYWTYGSDSVLHRIRIKARFNLILLLALIVFVARRQHLRYAIASGAFLACSLAAAVAFYAQHAGWTYQAYPFQSFLLLAVLWIVFDIVSPLTESWRFNAAFVAGTLAFTLLLFAPLIVLHHRKSEREAAHRPYLQTLLAQYPPQTPVYVFSTSLDAFPAVLEDHLAWASRFPALWMLPAIVQNEAAETGGPVPKKILPPATVERLAALQRMETTEDLRRWKPAVVIVRQCSKSNPCQALNHLDFDPLAWFLKSPDFAAEWAHYHLQTRDGPFDVYARVR